MEKKRDRFDLSGKVALVTAAAGGFGMAVSQGLAEYGADLAITDIREDAVSELAGRIRASGGRVISARCDIKNAEDIQAIAIRTVEEYGHIDILINIAGFATLNPVLDMTYEEFDLTTASTLRGAFLISQIVGRIMVGTGSGGSIIHMSSIASARALGRGTGVYAANKAGINALVRELAVELAPHQIRVNAIAPCQFKTLGFDAVLDNPKFGGREKVTARMLGKIPIGRFGEPEEIVGPCIFLASQAASMVTGHVLFVDGGYMAI